MTIVRNIYRHMMLLLMALSATAAVAQINTDQVMRIGQNALYFEDYVLSIQYFNQVIKSKPYLAEPYFFRSVAKIDLDDYKGAEDDATLCIERNPFIVDAYQVRGVARQNQQKFELAISDYAKGLELRPDNKTFLFNKAICEVQLKKFEVSDSTFDMLQRLDPKNERIYLGMAQRDLARGDTLKALADIDKSLAVSKNSAMAYGMRADINGHFKKDYAAALADMDSLIKLEPHQPDYYINRAYYRYKTDDYFGCMSDYDYAIGLRPDNAMAIYNRAQLNAEVGEDGKAIADFSRVLEIEPSNFLALYNRAQLYMRTAQFRNAVRDYDRILKKYPNFESGYMARAQAKQRLGDAKGSEADNNRAIAIFKKKGTRVATFNPAEQEARQVEKKITQERENARKAHDLNAPDDPEEILKQFNQLLTVKSETDLKPEYDNHSRGHVQNRNVEVDPMSMFGLTYYSEVNKLNGKTHYMKEVTEVNDSHMLPMQLSVSNNEALLDSTQIGERFASIEYYNGMLATSQPRSIDYLARAVDFLMVKNAESALADVDRAIKQSPAFALAYFLRANAHYQQYQLENRSGARQSLVAANKDEAGAAAMLHAQGSNNAKLVEMIADLNEVLKLSPKNIYSLYDKGNAYLLMGDCTAAISCYSQAIALKPDLGEAYYNRGLMYFRLGNREKGMADLSKAGELGILPSYNVLKRMAR